MLRWMYQAIVPATTRKRLYDERLIRRARRQLRRYPSCRLAPRHSLAGEVVISLTSFPPRFPTLHLTIKSLLDQTVRPDKVVLWIAHDDYAKLPETVLDLRTSGLTIERCEDLRNFKKIVPSLLRFPDAYILIADDDIYYPHTWLEGMLNAFDPAAPTVVCYRAHRPAYTETGSLAPYADWDWDVWDEASTRPSRDLLATGIGGVLYPPGSLPAATTNLELIRRLSATSDDVWLFFMWREAGWSIKRVPGPRMRQIEWPNSQQQSLFSLHRGGKKDEHLADMARHFGVPRD